MKRSHLLCYLMACILTVTLTAPSFAVGIDEVRVEKPVKNVILMIPDGMSTAAVILARWYNGGDLNLDSMASGLVRTYSSDAPIADSAPASSAMATGYKTHTGFIGVLPDVNSMPGLEKLDPAKRRRPVANILEAAKLSGRATGVVATCEIMQATPATFTAHYPDRKAYDILSKQQAYSGVDVVLGGGTDYFKPAGRSDGNDLYSVIKQDYQVVHTSAEMNRVTSGKVWGMFAPSIMAYDLDRDASQEPSLAEMTKKAIELLSQDEDGFFLMVEGSKIDWAAHSNDPVALVSDCLAFDKAVGVALDFAKQNGETVVIAATDHGTGGISIGNSATSSTYDEIPLNDIIAPLKKATLTGEGLEKVMAPDRNNAVEVLAKYYGLSNLTSDEIEAVKENTYYGYLGYTVGPMLAQHCGIGFTTGRHTGEDVTLYVYAPRGVDQLTGTVENTDIARYMEILMGLSLDDTTKKLFVPARKAFEAQGAKVEFDTTDKKNPVLTVTRGETIIKMPVHTNIAYVNGAAAELEGVVVFDGVGTTYVPQGALELLQ